MFKIAHTNDTNGFYATQGSAGFDVCSEADYAISPGKWQLVSTGLRIVGVSDANTLQISGIVHKILPELQIRPRSGLAAKFGVTILNSPATIDSDYRGEIKVNLVNLGSEVFLIKKGDRIAQAICALVLQLPDIPVQTTVRGEGGFGSTGI